MKAFDISLEGMQDVVQRLNAAFKKGLENEEEAVVKMFITFVHALPDGTEEGDFLALDLGGSNFRVLQLSKSATLLITTFVSSLYHTGLQRGGKMAADPKVVEMKISEANKTGTQEKLFDFIAQSMADFLKQYKIDRKLPLGFTFSFPVAQTSLTAGVLKKWTKDFNGSGAVGRDVIEMLQEALSRRDVSSRHFTLVLSN